MGRFSMRTIYLSLAVILVATVLPARAADISEEAPATEEAVEQMFDVAFGATVTSDYIFRGITQTDHNAAVQGYVEPSFGIFYAGIWASNVAFGGESDVEIDYYAGIRPEFDNLSLDFGYNYATYANDPASNAGELYAKAYLTVMDPLTIGAEFYVDPNSSATYVEGNVDLTLPHNFGLSGALGQVSGDVPYLTWNAGLYYVIGEWGTLDLRYTDTSLSTGDCATLTELSGNECDARVMLSLSVDLALSSFSE
jgi:uncharacterized protein (TIGR02001 family)